MLPLSYIVFTLFVILLILLAYRRVLHTMPIPARDRSRKFMLVSAFMIGWLVYLSVLALTGILKDLSLPPKFLLLIFLPLMIGFVVFYRRSKNSRVIKAIPKVWPVYFQSFRIGVEVLILYTFYAGILPQTATFEGLNFDVLMGLSAPFVAYFLVGMKKSKMIQFIWNILGILMVLFVAFIVATSMYIPEFWGSETPLVRMSFVEMPFLLLAGFLAPLAIFMHIVSLIQLRK